MWCGRDGHSGLEERKLFFKLLSVITFLGLNSAVLKQLPYMWFRKKESKPKLKYFVLQANPLFEKGSLFQMVSTTLTSSGR